jgi:hypothetical protein
MRERSAAPFPGSATMDLVRLGAYYAEMSDEELLAQAAEGVGAFVPETWTIIAHEISKRSLEMRPPEIYFALNFAVGLTVHWSGLLNFYLLVVAMLYAAAAVRMKRRQSVRAAAVAFALAVAIMLRHGYFTLTKRYWESSFWNMAMFAVVAYLFANALLAARSLRDDRAAAALALAVSAEPPSSSTSAGLATP